MELYPKIPGNMPAIPSYVPVGSVIAFAGMQSPPVNPTQQLQYHTVVESQGWMVCDGRPLNKVAYGMLHAALGDVYSNSGTAKDEFCIPDYRGYFLRMVDMGSNNDPDASQRKLPDGSLSKEVGSIQDYAMQYHEHTYVQPAKPMPIATGNSGTANAVLSISTVNTSEPVADPSIKPPPSTPPPDYTSIKTSYETRPKNVYVYYLIKFM